MCAIVDADAVKGLLRRVDAVNSFLLEQVENGNLKVALGGTQLRKEYEQASCLKWFAEAVLAGLVRQEDDGSVDALATQLTTNVHISSNDHHIIALAQISGARLLHSYDGKLRDDFKKKVLIDEPRGNVYASYLRSTLTRRHRNLLRKRLCSP